MYKETTIRRIGNGAGTTIPKKMLERHNLSDGDKAYLIETELGILVSPYDPDFAEAMVVYREGSKAYRNAMRELAK